MTTPIAFGKRGHFHKVHGNTAYGWAFVSTIKGQPYFDTGDGTYSDHIPVDSIIPVSNAFMKQSRVGLDMHGGPQVADVLHSYPMTPEIMAGNEISSDKTGLMIGWTTDDTALLEKIAKGERTGFSIGGLVEAWDIVDIDGNVIESVQLTGKSARFGNALKFGKSEGDAKLQRRVFRAWKLKEISLVDFPMQEPALVGVVKGRVIRSVQTFAKVAVLTSSVDGHQHVVDPSECGPEGCGRTSYAQSTNDEYGHDHAWVRGPNGEIVIADNEGHTHTVDVPAKPMNTATVISMRAENLPQAETPPTVKAHEGAAPMANENNTNTEAITKRAELAEKRADGWRTMSDVHKAYATKLTTTDQLDAFLFKSVPERDVMIQAAEAANPVVYTSKRLSRDFRKSDDPALVEIIKQADKDAEELAKSRTERDDAVFSKAALAFSHLPFKKEAGKFDDATALVKALNTIEDKTQRERIMVALKAADAIAANGFEGATTEVTEDLDDAANTDASTEPTAPNAPNAGDPAKELDKMAQALATKEGIHKATAKRRLIDSDPKARALYTKALRARPISRA